MEQFKKCSAHSKHGIVHMWLAQNSSLAAVLHHSSFQRSGHVCHRFRAIFATVLGVYCWRKLRIFR